MSKKKKKKKEKKNMMKKIDLITQLNYGSYDDQHILE